MTIAQRFIELGEQMGIDTSNCKTGNIGEVLNTLIQEQGGTVADSQNISVAMMNFTQALNGEPTNDETPSNNEEPTEPTEPETPSNNEEPTKPTEPETPDNNEEPTEPTEPETPSNNEEPTEP